MQWDEELGDLLGYLYQGCLEDPPWQTFLGEVRERMGAQLVTLLLRPPGEDKHSVMLADGGSLSAIKSYNEGQFVLDPFVNLPHGEVVTLQEFVGPELLINSDFYRIIMKPQGWYDFLGADLRETGELDVRFRIGRYQGARAFSESEKRWVQQLLPHLERAIRLHTRINRSEGERAVYEGAVQQLAVATFILDEQGGLLSCNELASELLSAGEIMREQEGRLEFIELSDRADFDRLVQDALQGMQHATGTVQALQLHGATGDLGLVLRTLPVSKVVQGRGIPSVAVFVSDPQRAAQAPLDVITSLFGFTPTEASLAMLLANGLTLDEASDELGISRNTARTHLRAVFAKTGVTRQTGLVSLILKSVAPLA